jgi:sugar phosphate isomerase/epimerase
MNGTSRTSVTARRATASQPDDSAGAVTPSWQPDDSPGAVTPSWQLGILSTSLQAPAIDAIEACRHLGIDLLEVGVEAGPPDHAIWSDAAVAALAERSARWGVRLHSACGQVFNTIGFGDDDDSVRRRAAEILQHLLPRCRALGIDTLLLPFFGAQALRSEAHVEHAVQTLTPMCPVAEDLGVVLALETTLPAADWAAFVSALDHRSVGAYFDIGNAVGLGFDPVTDLAILAPHLRGVHVKDRNSGVWDTTYLGSGGVDFAAAFHALERAGYDGPLVLETPVIDDPIIDARRNLDFVRQFVRSSDPTT